MQECMKHELHWWSSHGMYQMSRDVAVKTKINVAQNNFYPFVPKWGDTC